jgi:hypothetical protein
MIKDIQNFLDNAPAPSGDGKAAASGRTFQRGMKDISDSSNAGQTELANVAHSVYSEGTGHVPTDAPVNRGGSWSQGGGHSPLRANPRGGLASWSQSTGHVKE